jgi:hypothetical protein
MRLERASVIGNDPVDFIMASGHAHRSKQAGYMTAPDRCYQFIFSLQRRGRPYMTVRSFA